MKNLNNLFLNDIYNCFYKNSCNFLKDIEITPKVNSELRSYNINLGRRSGKTEAILEFIKQHPETKFIFYSPNTRHLMDTYREKVLALSNCSLVDFSDYVSRRPYDIIILENYTSLLYNRVETLGIFENKIYTRMNSNRKDQIYIKVG